MNATRAPVRVVALLVGAILLPSTGPAAAQQPGVCAGAVDGDLCDDGKACTLEDACRKGTCVGNPVDALCALSLDSLTCYRARRGGRSVRAFKPRRGEAVLDELQSSHPADPQKLDVLAAAVVCSAAVAGVAVLPDGRVHEEGYLARAARTGRRGPRTRPVVDVETALGTGALHLKRPRRLLVPSGLALDGGGAPEPPATARRFTCYDATASGKKGRRSPFPPGKLTLTDLRGGPATYRVGRPRSVCIPEIAVAGGQNPPPAAHGGYFVCHRAKLAKGGRPPARSAGGLVSTTNRFGAEVVRAGKLAEICVPGARVPTGGEAPPPRFAFLTAPGEVNAALKTLLEGGTTAPRTPEAAAAAIAASDAAKAVIGQNLPETRTALLAALQGLPPDDEAGYTALAPIVQVAGDEPGILDHLKTLLLATPRGEEEEPHATPHDELVRHIALEQLAHHAVNGSAAAKERLLAVVQSPDPTIQSLAILHVYRVSPDRRLAQRTMRPLLAPTQRYLLYAE
jgi:hypothetical protein